MNLSVKDFADRTGKTTKQVYKMIKNGEINASKHFDRWSIDESEISRLSVEPSKKSIDEMYIGKIVIIRSYSSGVHYGTLVAKQGQQVIIKNARRVHYWVGAASLSQLSMEGTKKPGSCRISMPVTEYSIERVIEVLPCSKAAIKNLNEVPQWKM